MRKKKFKRKQNKTNQNKKKIKNFYDFLPGDLWRIWWGATKI